MAIYGMIKLNDVLNEMLFQLSTYVRATLSLCDIDVVLATERFAITIMVIRSLDGPT